MYMSYNSKHWNWSLDFCYKHRGFKLPCKWCIATNDHDLVCDKSSSVADVIIEKSTNDSGKWGLKPDHYDEFQAWI